MKSKKQYELIPLGDIANIPEVNGHFHIVHRKWFVLVDDEYIYYQPNNEMSRYFYNDSYNFVSDRLCSVVKNVIGENHRCEAVSIPTAFLREEPIPAEIIPRRPAGIDRETEK